ncbi:sensor histidine kinase [Maledivibacter halophilus]|uniref:histidine kinase n=1 Tax=Maledivibacter halophilus TaxID=36842 RepID=A0A1T5ILB0_9FIRM|nr:HAMP domain-containing sensor histidine kinase [Maledivibacter halophilus]SKC39971.1 His Kinase A (phospho-acceptor) domain-containing protein [Maledivibacter halophilus]
MKMTDKIFIILNWTVLFFSCISLIILYYSNIINPYLTILNVLIAIFSLAKIYINYKCIFKFERINEQVERAALGNLNTRILVRDDGILSKLVCNFNKVIEELQKTQENQITVEESRRKLMSNISHDIRTPLTSIIGYIDALRDDVAANEEERLEYFDIISKKSKDLKKLIDEIFYMAKLDSDEIEMNFQIYDIGEIIRESIIAFLPELNKKEIELRVNLPKKKTLVYVDKLSIIRILNNIFKNSIQYGSEGKILGIDLISTQKSYQINIWDRGQGIDEEHLPYIFDRLYIQDKTRNKSLGSSGLGLAIVKKLIEKHRGTIWVESRPYKKTVFSFTIPKL